MRSLFISHGAPSLVLTRTPAARFLAGALALPAAPLYVVVSAHWLSQGDVRVATAPAPATVYDFGGFEPALYRLTYPAPGQPGAGAALVDALAARGVAVVADPRHGFDHGVWVPLMLARPHADTPVLAVSLPYPASAAQAMAFGAILRASIDDVLGADVPLLTSGAMTHRLAAFGERDIDGPPLPEALAFREWMRERLEAGDRDALAGYRTQAPHAAWNHPTDEHLLPLFVAAGAGGWPARCLHASWEWGMLAMDAWQFGD